MLEVYRNGEPTKRLFLSIENANLWIGRQYDGAEYTVKPFVSQKEKAKGSA